MRMPMNLPAERQPWARVEAVRCVVELLAIGVVAIVVSGQAHVALGAEPPPTSMPDLPGNWLFLQYWNAPGGVQTVSGSVSVAPGEAGSYSMLYQWDSSGHKGSSNWDVSLSRGLLVATGVEKPEAGILLGVGKAEGCLSGVLFFPSSKTSGVCGLQLCRDEAGFDRSALAAWRTPDGAATLKALQAELGDTAVPTFTSALRGWIDQAGSRIDEGGTILHIESARKLERRREALPDTSALVAAVVKCLRTGSATCFGESWINPDDVGWLERELKASGHLLEALRAKAGEGRQAEYQPEFTESFDAGKSAGFAWPKAEVVFVKPGNRSSELDGFAGIQVLLKDASGRAGGIRIDGVVRVQRGYAVVKGLDWLARDDVQLLISDSGVAGLSASSAQPTSKGPARKPELLGLNWGMSGPEVDVAMGQEQAKDFAKATYKTTFLGRDMLLEVVFGDGHHRDSSLGLCYGMLGMLSSDPKVASDARTAFSLQYGKPKRDNQKTEDTHTSRRRTVWESGASVVIVDEKLRKGETSKTVIYFWQKGAYAEHSKHTTDNDPRW